MASRNARLLIAVLFAVCCSAAEFQLLRGASPRRVYPRSADGRATIQLEGSGPDGATVRARLAGSTWTAPVTIHGGSWKATLSGVPTGGPYTLELAAADQTISVRDLFVGDLWVLAGQSNMQGTASLQGATRPHPLVQSFDMTDTWVLAQEPLHNFTAPTGIGAGLGLPFAIAMVERTGVPIGLIPCARGGTSMDEWSPRLPGAALYGSMLRRIQAAGGRIAGLLWYQGEADAKPELAPAYAAKMEALVAALRADTGQRELPVYYVQIGRNASERNVASWNQVQEAQRLLEQRISHAVMAASIDLEMEDGIHIATDGLKLLGRRLAALATGSAKPGPRPARIRTEGRDKIRVTFTGVNGRLTADGRLWGFTIHDAAGRALPRVYGVRLDPADGNSLLVGYDDGKLPAGAMLAYGQGKNPYCNVRDEGGMALPAFGPMPIEVAP